MFVSFFNKYIMLIQTVDKMTHLNLKPFNVIDNTDLPEIKIDFMPVNGDPLEIGKEMYYVCESDIKETGGEVKIGVIPLVVKNPARIANIETYINCLSVAHRRVQFRKENNICDLYDCDEMIIS